MSFKNAIPKHSLQTSASVDSLITDTVHPLGLVHTAHSGTARHRHRASGMDASDDIVDRQTHKKKAGRLQGSKKHNAKQRKQRHAGQGQSLRQSTTTLLQDGGNTLATATDLGALSNYYSLQGAVDSSDPVDYYRFNLASPDTFSTFFSGLSAGYSLDLLNATGAVLRSSTNSGTTWTAANTNRTGGSVTSVLTAGTYYVRITPATITGNATYVKPGSYTLNFQPHNAPNTVTVAAQDSEFATTADYRATGSNDQTVINRAIADLGRQGGGTVVLMQGTYKLSDNVLITEDNMTLSGVGWSTVLQLSPGANLSDAGVLRSAVDGESANLARPRFSNQVFRHLSVDGNRDAVTDTADGFGTYGTTLNSVYDDIRIHDMPHYGFDPHENSYSGTPTLGLTIRNSLSDHNGEDGLTTDNCVNSTFSDNVLDSNGRHGINVVTASRNSLFENNVSTNNGGNGIVVQPGAIDLTRTSESNILRNNMVRNNAREGIYLYRSRDMQVTGNTITDNGRHGIRLRATSASVLSNNTIDNNGKAAADAYSGIQIDNEGSLLSGNNQVLNNVIRSTVSPRQRHGIYLYRASNSTVQGNTVIGSGYDGIRLRATTLSSVTGNTVENSSQSASNTYAGILLDADGSLLSTDNVVQNNQVRSTGSIRQDHGIYLLRAKDTQVSGNQVSGSGWDGIRLRGTTGSTVTNNLVENNGQAAIDRYAGILLDFDGTVLSNNNRVSNNTIRSTDGSRHRNGINVYRAQSTTITANTITGSGWEGMFLRGSSFSTVTDNIVTDSSQALNDRYAGILLGNDGTFFSTNNAVRNNQVRSTTVNRQRYGIAESSSRDDVNVYSGNVIVNAVRQPLYILGPNSIVQ